MSTDTKELNEFPLTLPTDDKLKPDENNKPNARLTNPVTLLWRFFKVLCEQPYLAVNTAFSVMTGLWVITMLMVGGLGANFNRLLEGDPITIVQVTVGVIALLCGTMGLTLIGIAVRQTARHNAQTASSEELGCTLSKIARRLDSIEHHQTEISDQFAVYASERKNVWFPRTSDVNLWSSFAPGTVLKTVFGLCATEIMTRRDAQGKLVHYADAELLEEAWVSRFEPHRSLASVVHILAEVKEDMLDERFENGLLRTIAAYRKVQEIANQKQILIDLHRVRLVVSEPKAWQNGSVFIGTKRAHGSNSQTHAFTLRYASMSLTAAKILNGRVDVTHSRDEFANYSAVADELEATATRTMTLVEAEVTYGHLVPNLENSNNAPIRFTRAPDPTQYDGDWQI